MLLSNFILDELRRVLPRLADRHGLTGAEIDDLVDALSIQAEVIEPMPGAQPDLRDAEDQPVLGTLLSALQASNADYLITGDKDLLALGDELFAVVASGQVRIEINQTYALSDAAQAHRDLDARKTTGSTILVP